MKQCNNCEKQFATRQVERDFYQKIKVPEPRLCADCRLQRRLAFRNERTLYKRTCSNCKKDVISLYSPTVKSPIYCSDCWYGDSWGGMDYARDWDPNRSFFDQLRDLRDAVPHIATTVVKNSCVNSDYCSWFDESRDCYLCFGSTKLEECMYSELLYDCKNTFDSTSSTRLERCYRCIDSEGSFGCVWGVKLSNCTSCYFSYDLTSCMDCLFSVNLRHKSNYILNKQVSPEEFKKQKDAILGSYAAFSDAFKKFQSLIRGSAIHKFGTLIKCDESTGNNLVGCGKSTNCFDSNGLEECHNLSYGEKIKDCMDCYATVHGSELCYEVFSHTGATNAQFNVATWEKSYNIQYSDHNRTSHDLFGCVGLVNEEYCILNKKYSPDEYKALRETIIADMSKRGEYGEFFPFSWSPFGYNETIAIDYFPLTREEALRRGYNWQDEMPGTYGKETLKSEDIPDRIADVPDTIVKEILACKQCGKNYKIIKQELEFYRSLNCPVPRWCPDCRYRLRLTFRNPRHLWDGSCTCSRSGHSEHAGASHCAHTFQTTYAPERTEAVFCEPCYQQEVV